MRIEIRKKQDVIDDIPGEVKYEIVLYIKGMTPEKENHFWQAFYGLSPENIKTLRDKLNSLKDLK